MTSESSRLPPFLARSLSTTRGVTLRLIVHESPCPRALNDVEYEFVGFALIGSDDALVGQID